MAIEASSFVLTDEMNLVFDLMFSVICLDLHMYE